MAKDIAVIGAGVSGLSCAVLLAEQGHRITIFAEETGSSTTSAAAGAIWYPYDVQPPDAAIRWALRSYKVFDNLRQQTGTGVSLLELRMFAPTEIIEIPEWAGQLGATLLELPPNDVFSSGFTLQVPLIDTTIYLPYLSNRLGEAGAAIKPATRFDRLDQVPGQFSVIVNCAGIGSRLLVPDDEVEPHRGQVVIVSKFDLPYAVVCDGPPLMYAIPRTNDCLFGGTNELSDDRRSDPATTAAILAECSRVLGIDRPGVIAERVGLRPFRRSGVCLRADQLADGRLVIHNYGHGGSGFTLSWGCAEEVVAKLAEHFA